MAAPNRPAGPVSPSQAVAQTADGVYRRDVDSDARVNGQNGQRWRLRARLLGGRVDGRAVHLDSLIPEIAVYITEAGTIACDRALPHAGEGRFVGTYRLATPSGPESPVYVAAV